MCVCLRFHAEQKFLSCRVEIPPKKLRYFLTKILEFLTGLLVIWHEWFDAPSAALSPLHMQPCLWMPSWNGCLRKVMASTRWVCNAVIVLLLVIYCYI